MMASTLFDEIIRMVDRLTPQEQAALVSHLLEIGGYREMGIAERKELFERSILNVPVNQTPSVRRQDWYDDDGR